MLSLPKSSSSNRTLFSNSMFFMTIFGQTIMKKTQISLPMPLLVGHNSLNNIAMCVPLRVTTSVTVREHQASREQFINPKSNDLGHLGKNDRDTLWLFHVISRNPRKNGLSERRLKQPWILNLRQLMVASNPLIVIALKIRSQLLHSETFLTHFGQYFRLCSDGL